MNQNQTITLSLALVLVAALAVGVYLVRRRVAQRASEVLATRLTPEDKAGRQIQFVATNY